VSDWGGERLREDKRWQYGTPPASNANFAWVQHIVHHLAPAGVAGFVLANGSMSSDQSGEGEIRRNLIEADLVDCMVALPGQLFYSTQIPACLWFLARDRKNGKFRDRRGHVLFIDARKLGRMVDRTHRELTDEDIARITNFLVSPDMQSKLLSWAFIVETERRITPEGVSNSSTRLASALSTVIASAGQGNTRGQTSLIGFDTYINQSVVALRPTRRRATNWRSQTHRSQSMLICLIMQLQTSLPLRLLHTRRC
jgi:hypothetical protein